MFQTTEKGDVIITLYVIPNAPKNEIVGEYNQALKVKIHAPPVEGKANDEILRFFSKFLNVSKSQIQILKGDKSKLKKILISNMNIEKLKELIKNK